MDITIGVVICTKDRGAECMRCVDSITKQSVPANELVIVDASQSNTLHNHIKGHLPANSPTILKFIHVDVPGLTYQRNVAIDAIESDVVLFTDDDAVLEPNCLDELRKTYLSDLRQTIGGIQPAILEDGGMTPWGDGRGTPWGMIFRKFFMLGRNEDNGGIARMLPSGQPQYVSVPKARVRAEVFRGIASYRRAVFAKFRFDENLQGSGISEDTDFSYRVSQDWLLFIEPSVRIHHFRSPNVRAPLDIRYEIGVRHDYYLFCKNIRKSPSSLFAFLWANVGSISLILIQALKFRSYRPVQGMMRGFLKIIRGIPVNAENKT